MGCYTRSALADVDREFAAIVGLAATVVDSEILPGGQALGRVTAVDVQTAIPLPPFDHSAVDGYGIALDDVGRDRPRLRVVGRVLAGGTSRRSLRPGEAVRLLTGAAVPCGVAAVAFEERCELAGDIVRLGNPIAAGANIRREGEDVASGEPIVEAGTLLDARHLALLAAAGVTSTAVRRRVRVAVLSNGDELREPGTGLEPGAVHDSNRPMLLALLSRPWVEPIDAGLQRDDLQALASAIERAAARADAVVCSGGASGSDTDHVLRAILARGGKGRSIRLALKPGKPLVVGSLRDRPILGLPGNPVAAMVNFLLFGRPLLLALAGAPATRPAGEGAIATELIPHTPGRREFLPARVVGREPDGRARLVILGRGGSARLRPLVLGDGLAEIAPDRGDIAVGAGLNFHPFAAAFAP